MSSAKMAILDHFAEDPTHNSCPPGKESLCSYNRDCTTGQSIHKPIQKLLPKAIVEVLKPLFEKLRSVQFLSSATCCRIQNVNE